MAAYSVSEKTYYEMYLNSNKKSSAPA